jgi:hypothetical protein
MFPDEDGFQTVSVQHGRQIIARVFEDAVYTAKLNETIEVHKARLVILEPAKPIHKKC